MSDLAKEFGIDLDDVDNNSGMYMSDGDVAGAFDEMIGYGADGTLDHKADWE